MFLLWSSLYPARSHEAADFEAAADTSKMDSPNHLKGRLTKQVRRALPLYVACIFLLAFISAIDSLSSASFEVPHVAKRSLSSQKPLGGGLRFPRKTWQTWRVGPLGFEERDLTCARTWTTKNPGHRYEVLTDDNDQEYVEYHYGAHGSINRPDIVSLYRSLNTTIVKADLLRYLIMYAEGGVYADIDVEALRPVDRFIPERYDEKDVDMVIGVEIDQPSFKDHPILGKKSQSFCQWTFMCKPRLPVMMRLIEDIMKWLKDIAAKQKVPISQVVLDFDDIISGTGPSAFTKSVLIQMSKTAGRSVPWDEFHSMTESKLVGRVLVLTVEAFAAGQGHSDSGNHNSRGALVKHHYHASGWPSNHPRYTHPVYGQVESCNWEPNCVRRWDEDVAAFKSLSPEEQSQKVAVQEAENAKLNPGFPT